MEDDPSPSRRPSKPPLPALAYFYARSRLYTVARGQNAELEGRRLAKALLIIDHLQTSRFGGQAWEGRGWKGDNKAETCCSQHAVIFFSEGENDFQFGCFFLFLFFFSCEVSVRGLGFQHWHCFAFRHL